MSGMVDPIRPLHPSTVTPIEVVVGFGNDPHCGGHDDKIAGQQRAQRMRFRSALIAEILLSL